METRELNGVEYCLVGGDFQLACPNCGHECCRKSIANIANQKCAACKTQLEAVRVDELKTKWQAVWKKRDDRIEAGLWSDLDDHNLNSYWEQ
jgi:hypothetical protein